MRIVSTSRSIAIALASTSFAPLAVSAATVTWDGGAATLNWSDPANWSSDTTPATADTVVFHDTGFGDAADYTVQTGGDQTVTVLRFGTTGANAQKLTKNLTVAGNRITLLGNPTNNNTLNGTAQATGALNVTSDLTLSTSNGIANFNRGGTALLSVSGAVGEAAGNPQSLHKTGAGAISLSGPLSYTGGTFVEAGTLLIDGTGGGGGPFSVSGGTLGGSGVVGGAVSVADDGTLAPGAISGTLAGALKVAGSVDLNGTLKADLDAAGVADLLDVDGALTLGAGATLVLNELTPADGPYVLARYKSIVGEFANVVGLPDGYSINYALGGDQIALVQAPEPGSLALLSLAATPLLLRRRRTTGA